MKNVWNHQEYWERDIERELIWSERVSHLQYVSKNDRENIGFLNYFVFMFFSFSVNIHLRIRYSIVLCIFDFWFPLIIVVFYLILYFVFILHLFPYLINPLRAKYGNSFTHPLFAKSSWRLGREGEGERDGSFGVRECDEEERWIPLWCLDETFQNSKWESVSLIHSDILCRPLQMLQDQMGRRKLLTWLTTSRSEFVGLI